MLMESRQRKCSKCGVELVNSTGVHMGIPFGNWTTRLPNDGYQKMLVCARCYDEITIKDNIQRTGDETI